MTVQTTRKCEGCGLEETGRRLGRYCRDCYEERTRDLVWKNRDVIDFTGFEDIKEDIDRAVRGS
jgi:hypothetical protein